VVQALNGGRKLATTSAPTKARISLRQAGQARSSHKTQYLGYSLVLSSINNLDCHPTILDSADASKFAPAGDGYLRRVTRVGGQVQIKYLAYRKM